MRLTRFVTWVPEQRLNASDIILAAGASASEARVFSQLFGFRQVAALDSNVPLASVFHRLLSELQRQSPHPERPADVLIYAHGMPVQAAEREPWLTQLGREHPFIRDHAPCYELDQQNCATLFWALALAQRLLSQQRAKRVAIIAGDTLSAFAIQERYFPGCTIVGDAFAALLLENQPSGFQIGPVYTGQRPEFHEGIHGSEHVKKAFYQAHDELISDALQNTKSGNPTHLHLLPHNVNRLSWLNYSRRHQHPLENIALGLMPNIGHCYTVDPLLLLPAALPAIQSGKPHVMLSVGLGAWIGSCRIRHADAPF
ncbi:3-oxoacyl-ACP synthase III [Dickeya solani]|uniref:3-Oxoacyl-(Acyl-carrier-protein (ACP)) synthase III domain protein n=1 Tax=Dickeya solani D s0432-1 TaxID=1231725 RepID=A0AAV3KF48_9GAMM|nr:3-oxoacyl-ACP synthase III [Dickeya solani]ANE75574.1 3-oxoacyl-ACP synthase [Dickeya solani IPO 2222]AUC43024.1 3-Oxoacyl-(acyl-carrier-protein (ACP)) synthase III domain protein [Dickeya solani RNS 08.23.3.1.A]AUH09012.1 3-oxoacyl-ACP synthase [Dickeya solani D s0432-1]AYQ45975.1 3-oxoacyl-(acyl carrier protein) synthase III [Dickeya solani]AYQ50142.1 3-oxoacyl-(acyl carrier protein) synthase III [Dickeya solani]